MESNGPAEIAALLMKHRIDLHAYLRAAVRDPHEAEDLLQDVSMAATSSWEDFVPGTNFLAWAREIARRRILDSTKRRRPVVVDPEFLQQLERAAASAPPVDPQRDALRLCLEGIQGTSRQVLEQRYSDRKSVGQIAESIRKTVQSTYAILKRTRQALRDCMERRMKS